MRQSVLLLDTSKEFRGGQRQLTLLAGGLRDLGRDVHIGLRPERPLHQRLRDEGYPLLFLDPKFEGAPGSVFKVARYVDDHAIPVINSQTSHDHTLGWLAQGRAKSRPVHVVTRRVDFAPKSGWFHRRKYGRGADHYIAISEAIRRVLLDWGIPGERATRIYSSVTPIEQVEGARESVLAEFGLEPETILLGNVAGLVDHKGQRYLIDAVDRVIAERPNVVLLIAGDGPLRGELEAATQSLKGHDRIKFLGWRQDIPRLLSALDLFVMTSHMEGLCTSILDAMSARVPVVATKAGGIPEIVRDGETGWLAENKNPSDIAARILHALDDTESTRIRVENAAKMVETEFSVREMSRSTAELYARLVAQR
ncbi:MAG: glycosyltransferase family 4 protein [Deltaproteobacteria bacterium]|nr:glycosyltransferase family 4 protein [Deltaproteobacteria bacterium]